MARMDFGVFDHLDRGDLPPHALYETRLKLIEAYDAAGFYAYHLAERHFTPLGMAPSPSRFPTDGSRFRLRRPTIRSIHADGYW